MSNVMCSAPQFIWGCIINTMIGCWLYLSLAFWASHCVVGIHDIWHWTVEWVELHLHYLYIPLQHARDTYTFTFIKHKQQVARRICFLFALYIVCMFVFARKQKKLQLSSLFVVWGLEFLFWEERHCITVLSETNTLLPLSRIVE